MTRDTLHLPRPEPLQRLLLLLLLPLLLPLHWRTTHNSVDFARIWKRQDDTGAAESRRPNCHWSQCIKPEASYKRASFAVLCLKSNTSDMSAWQGPHCKMTFADWSYFGILFSPPWKWSNVPYTSKQAGRNTESVICFRRLAKRGLLYTSPPSVLFFFFFLPFF